MEKDHRSVKMMEEITRKKGDDYDINLIVACIIYVDFCIDFLLQRSAILIMRLIALLNP